MFIAHAQPTPNTGGNEDGYYDENERTLYDRGPVVDVSQEAQVIRWQRGGLIGAGAFGKVFLALNLGTGELLAVKEVSLTELGADSKEAAALEHEVTVMKSLNHANIVRYLGANSDKEVLHIFLEFMSGGSIAGMLKKFGRFAESVVRVYTVQALQGLAYLHAHHIIHRDIKGANLLVDAGGVVKLADFGASKRLAFGALAGANMSLRGTPYWMAPEVIKQSGHGRQADIWSIGCSVLEMAQGHPPWNEYKDQVSALFAIANAPGGPGLPSFLSRELRDFLTQCLQRNPKDRPNAIQLLKHPFLVPEGTPRPAPSSSKEVGVLRVFGAGSATDQPVSEPAIKEYVKEQVESRTQQITEDMLKSIARIKVEGEDTPISSIALQEERAKLLMAERDKDRRRKEKEDAWKREQEQELEYQRNLRAGKTVDESLYAPKPPPRK